MKYLLNKIKRLLGIKIYKPALCGTINTQTGQTTKGFQNDDGEIIYKKDKSVNVWGEPEYVTTLTHEWTVGSIFHSGVQECSEKLALYREHNKYNGKLRYFYKRDGLIYYIDSNAWEKDNKVIRL